jgi:uncharacterized membrane protein
MEAVRFSGTSANFYGAGQRHIPEDSSFFPALVSLPEIHTRFSLPIVIKLCKPFLYNISLLVETFGGNRFKFKILGNIGTEVNVTT